MIARPLEYFEPHFLEEALVVLDRFDGRARALAGGTRLVPELRTGLGDVEALVNLKRIAELHAVTAENGTLSIGALTTAAGLCADAAVLKDAPLLAYAASTLGSVQVRTLATLGGNICCGDPASDLTTALLALDATCCVASLASGERRIALEDLLVPGGADLRAGEVLTRILVPISRAVFAYRKMATRRGFEMALVAVAVALERAGTRVERVRIALAGAGPTCLRAPRSERRALDALAGPSDLDAVAALAADHDSAPQSDLRASALYRRQLIRVLTRRCLDDVRAVPS
ncbi:MAG TPA: FAD binding domain-containing protein [Candidatus Eremiobacteraceae bacterium]|nr:FAD binding domain-containing protein [Candidatus Eremiobacteraceae bacterium]